MDNVVEIFPWNDKFSIGIELVDEQHRRLIELLNRLAGRMATRAESRVLESAFGDLTAYALFHFESEEAIWVKYLPNDGWEREHKQSHENFVAEILRIKSGEAGGSVREMQERLLSFLIHWLVFHILESDKLLAKVVLGIQSGLPLAQAKKKAGAEMNNATLVLIDAVLAMNNDLSERSFALANEIEERKKVEASLTAARDFNQTLIQSMQDGFSVHALSGEILEANPTLCTLTGFSKSELLGTKLPYPFTPADQIEKFRDMQQKTARGETGDAELVFQRKDTTRFSAIVGPFFIRDGQGKIVRFAATVKDITERKLMEEQTRQLALFDALTKLPNRRLLSERLAQSMAAGKRYGYCGALMFLDLDNFKPLNDRHGHALGDLLLVEVAQRLTHCVREADTVARIGGDEFVVMIDQLHSDPDECIPLARNIAEKIRVALSEPYLLADAVEHQCSASIGVTLYLGHDQKPQEIMAAADRAMYQAKAEGRNQICFIGLGA